ncbi:MAG: FG-GAP repeat domain-containing protein [Planctomycetota bacterium]
MHSPIHAALNLALTLALGSASAFGQRVQWSALGSLAEGRLGTAIQTIADQNGDGRPDVVATAPGVNGAASAVHVLSGLDGTSLRVMNNPVANSGFGSAAAGIGDVDSDGTEDIAIGASLTSRVFVYSGSTGALLRTITSTEPNFGSAVSAAGDVDGDRRPDVAVYSDVGVSLHRGDDGAPLGAFPNSMAGSTNPFLQLLPDVDGDGQPELLLTAGGADFLVLDVFPTRVVRRIPRPAVASSSFGVAGVCLADIDGDGVVEVLIVDNATEFGAQRGAVFVFSLVTYSLIDSVRASRPGETLAVAAMSSVGDLDSDAHDEVALMRTDVREVAVLFGRTRSIRSFWTPSSQYAPLVMTARSMTRLDDMDGDGFSELALSNPFSAGSRGQCFALSSGFLASVTSLGNGCGEGPFLPRIGVSRPILGATAQIAIRDAPLAAPGIVVFSAAPLGTTNLGAQGCDAVFSFAAWGTYANLSGSSSYDLTLPIPQVPQFAGIDLALQCLFGPTNGPLGFDLSNGIWARVGYR